MAIVGFRADASARSGEGHIRRCVVLAQALRRYHGLRSHFFCRTLTDGCRALLEHRQLPCSRLPRCHSDADEGAYVAAQLAAGSGAGAAALVVDHYTLASDWEKPVADSGIAVVVIDDLADRPHHCALLIDPSPLRRAADYRPWLQKELQKALQGEMQSEPQAEPALALGGRFALLPEVFADVRRQRQRGAITVQRDLLHLFFGAVDNDNHSQRFATYLLEAAPNWRIKAAVGPDYRHGQRLQKLAAMHPQRLQVTQGTDNMALHMADCAAAIGAPGSATWERVCLGIPSLLVATADNQIPILEQLCGHAGIRYMGGARDALNPQFVATLQQLLEHSGGATAPDNESWRIDGYGAKRVAQLIAARLATGRAAGSA